MADEEAVGHKHGRGLVEHLRSRREKKGQLAQLIAQGPSEATDTSPPLPDGLSPMERAVVEAMRSARPGG